MDNFNFTKSFINPQLKNNSPQMVKVNEINKIEKIFDNMKTINSNLGQQQAPKVEEFNNTPNDIYRNRIQAIKNIKKD